MTWVQIMRNFSSIPLYRVATGLRTIQFLLKIIGAFKFIGFGNFFQSDQTNLGKHQMFKFPASFLNSLFQETLCFMLLSDYN
jgi:hypothetical protein